MGQLKSVSLVSYVHVRQASWEIMFDCSLKTNVHSISWKIKCALFPATCVVSKSFLIIIMYIYHALINALSAHMIHINLTFLFFTHVEHSPTKTIYIKYYMEKQTHALHTHTHTD